MEGSAPVALVPGTSDAPEQLETTICWHEVYVETEAITEIPVNISNLKYIASRDYRSPTEVNEVNLPFAYQYLGIGLTQLF
ncbi:hypothetical protein BTVI_99639 [Pitangus sulphuratus]|nr:hypothetical protein BTVI_99639 [Pitangus sulphuratus]